VSAGENIAVNFSSPRIYQHTTASSPPPLPQLDLDAGTVTGLVRYTNPRLRYLGPALLVGVGVAVTAGVLVAPGWALVGLLVGALVWVVLSIAKTTQAERTALASQRRRIRSAVLDPMTRLEVPAAEQTVAALLDPRQSLIPLQARPAEKKALLSWCHDPAAGPIRILSGVSGVGKSRLAVEIAETLVSDGWVAGRCGARRASHVLDPVVACGDPTLIVVDDADTEPDIPDLIRQATSYHDEPSGPPVKILLIVRDGGAYQQWLSRQPQHPINHRLPHTVLKAVGAASDRQRWFAQIANATATAFGLPRPALSSTDTRPVGVDGEPMVSP
jgi:hypothetical protein